MTENKCQLIIPRSPRRKTKKKVCCTVHRTQPYRGKIPLPHFSSNYSLTDMMRFFCMSMCWQNNKISKMGKQLKKIGKQMQDRNGTKKGPANLHFNGSISNFHVDQCGNVTVQQTPKSPFKVGDDVSRLPLEPKHHHWNQHTAEQEKEPVQAMSDVESADSDLDDSDIYCSDSDLELDSDDSDNLSVVCSDSDIEFCFDYQKGSFDNEYDPDGPEDNTDLDGVHDIDEGGLVSGLDIDNNYPKSDQMPYTREPHRPGISGDRTCKCHDSPESAVCQSLQDFDKPEILHDTNKTLADRSHMLENKALKGMNEEYETSPVQDTGSCLDHSEANTSPNRDDSCGMSAKGTGSSWDIRSYHGTSQKGRQLNNGSDVGTKCQTTMSNTGLSNLGCLKSQNNISVETGLQVSDSDGFSITNSSHYAGSDEEASMILVNENCQGLLHSNKLAVWADNCVFEEHLCSHAQPKIDLPYPVQAVETPVPIA